jgi:very-short-patch-repair endonuclease
MNTLNYTMVLALAVFLVMIVASVVVLRLRTSGAIGQLSGPQYEAIPALLTPAERSFFGVLQQALPSNCQVFVKVRLADIVRPRANPSRSGRQSALNRITGKHVDFVLCDLEQLSVAGVIELDDRSHQRQDRGIRDLLVDTALKDAGIPILRVPARASYSPAQLREQIASIFSLQGNQGRS